MAKFNDNQRHYFTHHLYSLITDLEMMDRRRAQMTMELLSKCVDLGDGLAKGLTESSTALRRTVSRIDPEEVSAFIITQLTYIVRTSYITWRQIRGN